MSFKMPSPVKAPRKEWNRTDIVAIKALCEAGHSRRQVASQLSIPESTVGRISRKVKLDPELHFIDKKRPGGPKKVTAANERRLVRHVRQNPFSTVNELTSPSKSGHALHRSTISRILQKQGIHSCKPRVKPFLDSKQAKNRLNWARQMHKMEVGKLSNLRTIIFTDESTFEVGEDSSAPRVLRKEGEAYLPQHLKPSFKSGRTSVSVWGAISYDCKGPLVFLPKGERLTAAGYITGILNQQGLQFYEEVTEKHGFAVWQQDGAPCHTAKSVMQWMRDTGVEVLPWPAQSPDLNPIENVWAIMKARISKRKHRITTVEALEAALKAEWDQLSLEDIQPIVGSMEERIKSAITQQGKSLKY